MSFIRQSADARTATLQAPVGGWDTRNALADMPIENAVIMDNWFPETDKVTVRRGYTNWATGLPAAVESLLQYTGVDGSGELYAASDGDIYDVTSGGAVGSAVASGFTTNRWQQIQIETAGGHFLLAVNGIDTPQLYNGSTWANATMTGPTIANLVWCNLHQKRLWFGETDSLTAWYLAVNAITGAATSFALGAIAQLGGYIVGMGTWSFDGGDGPDDAAVFLTSEGEAIIYRGTDPSSASTWALIGVFRIGKPIGRRCFVKAGGDLIVITQDGFVGLSTILTASRAKAGRVAISAQIDKAVNDAVRANSSLFGWEAFLYPKGTQLIFNVPQDGVSAYQFVFNTLTNAPCRFTGLDAFCWGLLNDNAFFGGTEVVCQHDTSNSDNGEVIEADVLQAFSYLGRSTAQKIFRLVEPVFTSDGDPNAALDLNLDWEVKQPTGVAAASPASGAKWGIAKWGIDTWGSASQVWRGWRGVRGIGRTCALRIRVDTAQGRPSWVATNFIYTPGGMI